MNEKISEENVGQLNSSIPVAPAAPAVAPQPAQPAPAVPAPAAPVAAAKLAEAPKKGAGRPPKAADTTPKTAQQNGSDVTELLNQLRTELAEVKELKDELKQKGEQLDTQIARAENQVFAASGATQTDTARHKSKADKMKEWIWKHPMKPIFIPLEIGEKRGEAIMPVTKNGYRLNVPKGVWIEVPEPIAFKVMQRLQQTEDALDNKFRLDKASPEKLDALSG